MARILIIDDDDAFRESLAETLAALGHRPAQVGSGTEAKAWLETHKADLVFLDLRMPGIDGIELLRELRSDRSAVAAPVIMLTAFAGADNTIEAMKLGAFDHLAKPLGRADIEAVLQRALKSTPTAASRASRPASESGDTWVGDSSAMREAQKLIGLAAASDANVLITGETGTGKELAARLLHRVSDRAGGPFVAVNCAAIPAELIESELFGHVRGAFTGAVAARRGAFREADGGSLFLDEIGDMPMALQAKILRALQERQIVPLGADRPLTVDVRIIAATHRALPAAVEQGRFRQDLYFRLAVVPIELPPLRAHPADIAALAEHFLHATAVGAPKRLSDAALAKLGAYAWPGNVRELRNVIERLSVVVRGAQIEREDLDFLAGATDVDGALPGALADLALPEALAGLERSMIERALRISDGNRAEAARRLGIHRQLLYAKLKHYGLE